MPAVLTGELLELITWLTDPTRQVIAHLAKNPVSADVADLVLADLVEADFPGYEPFVIDSWIPQDYGDDLYGEATSGEIQWQADGLTLAESVYVAYLTVNEDGQTPDLLQPIILPIPFVFSADGVTFGFEFRIASANLDALQALPCEG